jgi:RHS repeat-associated protein
LLEDSTFTYSYDANGNLVEQVGKGTGDRTVYTYDAENQLIGVDRFTVAGGGTPVLVADYKYDALGRRIEKNVNGVITRYVYDNEDIIFTVDGAGASQGFFFHGPGIDEPLAGTIRTQLGFQGFTYHADGLGSISTLTDLNGTPVQTYTYDSFGQIVEQTGTAPNPYTYTGRELDPETGLYYYRARYYDPSLGRFLQEDPLFTLNLYVYVQNNPVKLTDPIGLAPWDFKGYCRYISGGNVAGAGVLRCRVWTPCRRVPDQVSGVRETGELVAAFGGLTVGIPGAVTYFNIELPREPIPDYHFPTLKDLEGSASIQTLGFAIGPIGWSWMHLRLGSARTELIGQQAGIDLSADVFWGSSRLESTNTTCCYAPE